MERALSPTEPPTEREIAGLLLARLREVLPGNWDAEAEGAAARDVDAVVRIAAPDGREGRLLVEIKTIVNTRDVPRIANALSRVPGYGGAVVAARYLSPRTREALVSAGLSFFDVTGNLRVSLDEPGLFATSSGAQRDPYRGPDRPTNSLKGAPSAMVVRALVDRRPPWTMRALAAEAGTSLGSTARTVDFLDREALIDRDATGSIVGVDWEGLLRRWADDYELGKRGRVLALLAPRGLDAVETTLAKAPVDDYVISGSLAAQRIAPLSAARLGLVYARDAEEFVARVDARRAPSSPNLLVIEPSDDLTFLRSRSDGGLRFAALSQVFADLMAGPGRNPEEALALLEWMRAHEEAWRVR